MTTFLLSCRRNTPFHPFFAMERCERSTACLKDIEDAFSLNSLKFNALPHTTLQHCSSIKDSAECTSRRTNKTGRVVWTHLQHTPAPKGRSHSLLWTTSYNKLELCRCQECCLHRVCLMTWQPHNKCPHRYYTHQHDSLCSPYSLLSAVHWFISIWK